MTGNISKLFSGVAVLLYAFFCLSSLTKPLTTDEAEFGAAAVAIAETGLPIYYMGDTPRAYIPTKDLWQIDEAPKPGFQYGLWHPPLYLYMLGAAFKVFGPADWAARLVNVLLMFGTLWLIRGILGYIVPGARRDLAFGFAAILFLLNPLMLQQGLIMDFDNSVVLIIAFLILHEILRMEQQATPPWKKYGWLSVLIALSYWAKEFSGAFLIVPLFGWLLLQRRWKDLLWVVGVAVVGTALFWATWWVFCKLTGLPVMYFIRFTILGKLAIGEGLLTTMAKQGGWGPAWYTVWFSLVHSAAWVTPAYVGLALIAVGWRVREFFRQYRVGPVDLMMLYALVVLAATQVYRPSGWFLKYGMPAHAALAVALAVLLAELLGQLTRREWAVGATAAVTAAGLQVSMLADPLLAFFTKGPRGISEVNGWAFWIVGAVALVLALWMTRRTWPVMRILCGGLMVATVGAHLGLNWVQRAPYVTSISWNNYGEQGFRETVEFLKSELGPDDVPICRKDFGYHLSKDTGTLMRRWYNPAILTEVRTADEFIRNITAPGVTRIVLDRYSIRQDTLPILQQFYGLEKQIGSFCVLKRQGQ